MKNLLLAGAVVLFGGVAATGAAAMEHKSTRHAAPAQASMMTSVPAERQESAPKKHHPRKRHHGRKHHGRHSK
ncbi:MAG TPA: hypothetical protein VKW04_06545 [Planctomycetota bacterium]|nr:hypothetical protein [Planctomycetota bacterium]